eukprot:2236395-Amphidinium_carterae.2
MSSEGILATYALFLLLDPTKDKLGVARQLLQRPVCTRDSFTKSFLRKYRLAEQLCSAEALEILRVLGMRAQAGIYSTERLHSRNLRRVKARATTHQADLKHLGISHMGQSLPKWGSGMPVPALQQGPVKRKRNVGRPPAVKSDTNAVKKKGEEEEVGEPSFTIVFKDRNFQLITSRLQARSTAA